MRKYNILILLITLLFALCSCSDSWMDDTVPTNKQDYIRSIETLKDGRNALNGVFSLMQSRHYYGAKYIVYGDLKSTDVRSWKASVRDGGIYIYNQTTEASPSRMWDHPYACLASVANAINGIDKVPAKTEEEEARKKEIKANLYALRALIHFDLLRVFSVLPTACDKPVSEYDGVVLVDHIIEKDEQPKRQPLDKSYQFVIKDLKEAIAIMPSKAETSGWLNLSAVKSLLSRVYLYNGDFQKAHDMAKEVIDSKKYSLVKSGEYKKSWHSTYNNPEAIFTLINTEEDNPSREGIGYLWAKTGYNTMAVTTSFQDILVSDKNDERYSIIDSVIVVDKDTKKKKYKGSIITKYPNETFNNLHLIRLSELYFIAAEAIFHAKSDKKAAADLINEVLKERTKGKTQLSESDVDINKIILEKRKEFLGEGKSYFDYIRNKKNIVREGTDHLGTAPLNIEYKDFRVIQPIPRHELDANSNMKQNPGYAK